MDKTAGGPAAQLRAAMIVVMSTGKNVSGAVYYNEEKVNHGEAQLLKAANFASESLALQSEGYRRHVLEAYADKNVKIGKPCVHFALSFSPSENLPDSLIGQIGTDFMEQMGFADQPYLQYRHHDTHHPHIHIVSVLVDGEGQKVSERFSKSRCNEARKALELKYNLVQAEKQGKTVLMDGLLPEQILSFKEPEAKKAIGNVVRTAMTDYHFSSLISFSDFLHQHKIQLNVHQGQTKGGTPFRGLSFQLTNGDADRRGQAIGPAIKASSFGFAPTMDRLEDRFRVGTHQVAAGQRATLERIGVALREFSSISEADFKGQLRAQGVQVIDTGKQYVYVDHKSRNVYSEAELGPQFNYQRQQAAFTQRSERIPVPIPVPKPIIAPILKPAIAPKPPVEVKPQAQPKPLTPAPVIPPATPNPEHELAHRRRVSHHYQLARTKGVEGKPAPFFESQLIRQFPHQHLTQALLSEGIPRLDAQRAVSQFEAYKQGQLMEIKAKEESYFIQTATLLGKLAAQMPIAGESKAKFLQSMGLELSALGLIHQQDKYLRLPLTLTQLMELQADRGPRLVFREKATKHERNLYLAIADGQPVPAGVSFYQVSASQLKFSIGQERFAQLAPTLNGQFLEQVTTHLAEKREGWPQLAERGLLVERGAGNTLRVGHYFTDPSQFVALPKALADRLAGEAIPSMENQRQALQSGVGRNLMSLTQALDQGDTQRVAQMVATYARDKARSKSGSTIHTAESVRKELQERFLKLYETKPVSQTTARPTTTVQPAPTVQPVPTVKPAPNVPHSLYGERVVSLLLQASVSPVQRGELAQQLGLNWHVGREGSLRLIEGKSSPQPGASYLLSSQQQALLVKPEGGSNPVQRHFR